MNTMTARRTFIATDIFGKTDAVQRLAKELPGETKIIDPYDGKFISFDDESHAYATFSERVGPDVYAARLQEAISNYEAPFQLLGFSVGATACWRTACQDKHSGLLQTICIYGSQIRHHSHLQPTSATTVLLPAREASFDIQAHAEALNKIPRVTLKQTPYLHGFMNELSPNYNEEGYARSLAWLKIELISQPK